MSNSDFDFLTGRTSGNANRIQFVRPSIVKRMIDENKPCGGRGKEKRTVIEPFTRAEVTNPSIGKKPFVPPKPELQRALVQPNPPPEVLEPPIANELVINDVEMLPPEPVLNRDLLGPVQAQNPPAVFEREELEDVPVVQVPEAAPVVQVPEAAPVVQVPEAAPVVQVPEAAPVVQAPEAAPAVKDEEGREAERRRLERTARRRANRKTESPFIKPNRVKGQYKLAAEEPSSSKVTVNPPLDEREIVMPMEATYVGKGKGRLVEAVKEEMPEVKDNEMPGLIEESDSGMSSSSVLDSGARAREKLAKEKEAEKKRMKRVLGDRAEIQRRRKAKETVGTRVEGLRMGKKAIINYTKEESEKLVTDIASTTAIKK